MDNRIFKINDKVKIKSFRFFLAMHEFGDSRPLNEGVITDEIEGKWVVNLRSEYRGVSYVAYFHDEELEPFGD